MTSTTQGMTTPVHKHPLSQEDPPSTRSRRSTPRATNTQDGLLPSPPQTTRSSISSSSYFTLRSQLEASASNWDGSVRGYGVKQQQQQKHQKDQKPPSIRGQKGTEESPN